MLGISFFLVWVKGTLVGSLVQIHRAVLLASGDSCMHELYVIKKLI
jgi:hypothetical protein